MAAWSWYGTGLVAAQAPADDRLALLDQGPIPSGAVLLAEQHEGAVGPRARRAAGLGQEQQRQQAGHLRLVGHQRRQDPCQPDRLGAETRFGRAGQPGVVDEVDDGQHRAQAVGQLVILRHAVGDPGGLDLALGAHEALRHRRLGDEEGARDLLGRQPAEQAQGERHLRLRGERRVAAGEDEAKPVVLHGSRLLGHAGIVVAGREHRHLAEQFASTRLAAQAVDGTVAGGRRDPAARVGRQAVARPLAQGDGERLLHRILGDVDVAEDADQGGHRSAGLLAEDPADLGLVERRRGVDVAQSVRPRIRAANGRTSIGCPDRSR